MSARCVGRRRITGVVALVVALGSVLAGCGGGGGGDTDDAGGATTSTAATTSTTQGSEPIEPVVARNREESLEFFNRTCRVFFSIDPVIPDRTSNRTVHALAVKRSDAVRRVLDALDAFTPLPRDEALAAQIRRSLVVALAAAEELLAVPVDDAPPSADADAAVSRSQDELGSVAITLVEYGATSCLPTAVEPPSPPPATAGELVELEPALIVSLDNPLSDPRDLTVVDGFVYVGLDRSHELVKIDASTGEIVAQRKIASGGPRNPRIAAGKLWFGTEDRIGAVDPATLRDAGSVLFADVGVPSRQVLFTTSANGERLWLCGAGRLVAIDTATFEVSASTALAGRCRALVELDDERIVYSLSGDEEALIVADAGSLEAIETRPLSMLANGLSVGAGRLAVQTGPDLVVLDAATLDEVTRLEGRGPLHAGVFADDVYWSTIHDEWRVVRFDLGTGSLTEFVSGSGVLDIDLDGDAVWVANSNAATVMRFDVTPWPPVSVAADR